MKLKQYVNNVIKDPDRKNLLKILKEATHCMLIEKELPYYYFTSLLYKKNTNDYRGYIGFKKIYKIINNYFFKNGRNIELEDKQKFGKVLSDNGLRTPKILANNNCYTMYYENNEIKIENENELQNCLRNLINNSFSKSVFIKPTDGEGGKQTFKYDETNINNIELIKSLYLEMKEINFIFQENVIQNKEVSKIYSKSINTVRVHTVFDKETNHVEIVSALMRFGHGGSIVDNGSSGGFFVPIDIKNWTLDGCGYSYLKSGGNTYINHPDTNIKLDGFKIPFSDEIIEFVNKGAKLFPNNEFIGWDIALTDEGPIAIEGNGSSHLIMLQMACGGIRNNQRYKEIFKDYI